MILERAAVKLERLHFPVVGIHLFVLITHIEVRMSSVKMISMVSWRATAITIGFEST